MTTGAGLQLLWPTPIGLHRYPAAATLNPLLVGAFAEGRAAQEQRGELTPPRSAGYEPSPASSPVRTPAPPHRSAKAWRRR